MIFKSLDMAIKKIANKSIVSKVAGNRWPLMVIMSVI